MTGVWDGFAGRPGARSRAGTAARIAGACGVALLAANCSSPTATGSRSRASADGKYGVTASPRLYGENDAIPKGGGRAMVGKPYDIAGKTYYPQENPKGYRREGLASWYGTAFHGRMTANGEVFDRFSVAAAHPTLPLPSYARVTNLNNGNSMIVRVNDRGPYERSRLIDVSERVSQALEFHRAGTTRVRVEYIGPASTNGSDDAKLMASLRTDGQPAPFGGARATMIADASAAEARSEIAERKASAREAAAREAAEDGETPALAPAPTPRPRPAPVVQVASADPDDLPIPATPARTPVRAAAVEPVAVTTIVRSPVPMPARAVAPAMRAQAATQVAAVHVVPTRAVAGQTISTPIPPAHALPRGPLLRGALATHDAPPARAALPLRPAPMPLTAPPLKIVKSPMPPERPPAAPPAKSGRTAAGRGATGV